MMISPLKKALELRNIVIIVRPVFHEVSNYYLKVFLKECLFKSRMLEYDRKDMSKRIYVNKINFLRECIICHSWYFLKINFRFQPEVCGGCHDLMQKVMSYNDIEIVSIKGNNYRIHFHFFYSYMSKDEDINFYKHGIFLILKSIYIFSNYI